MNDVASDWATVLREELAQIRPRIVTIAKGATLDDLHAAIGTSDPPLSALCLSGGGIRSASFALGVLQTLARYGVLGQFDYLSTVSGGGYIGSFLTAWRKQAGNDGAVFAGLDRSRPNDGVEAAEIAGVRADGNYLTPKLGLLSADTWTVIALVIRNLVLNWLVFLPFFMGVLLVPWLCKHLLDAIAVADGIGLARIFLAIGAGAVTFGLGAASFGRRRAEGGWLTDMRFVGFVLLPIVVAGMGFSAAGAALAWTHAGQLWVPADVGCGAAVAGALCYALAWSAAGVLRPDERIATDPLDSPVREFLAWVAAGALAGTVLAHGIWLAASLSTAWLTALGISWTMLSIFAGELLFIGLRSYSPRGDADREWLARAAGWLGAWAVTWLLVATIALIGPVELGSVEKWAIGAVGGLSGLVALVLGGSAWTAATTAVRLGRRFSLSQVASVAGLVFAVVLAILISRLDVAVGRLVVGPPIGAWGRPLLDAIGAALLLGFGAGASWLINVNRFSLHAVYRNRLVRAFLGSARGIKAKQRMDDPFTGFDPKDNPCLSEMPKAPLLHVVNVALNVVSTTNLAWQERKAESFVLTPLRVGNPSVGYRATEAFCKGNSGKGITLGTAMAISGAAVSPNMGYHSSPLLGLLLMLFNVRLGWWLGNPKFASYGAEGPTFGLLTLLKELANMTTADGRWIYLSDGGHFDNLGIYEMVRRRCRFIVVSDAGCDPDAALADLGNAVRKASIDFGVRIRFDSLEVAAGERPPKDGPFAWQGKIWYPESEEPGWLLYLRPTYRGTEAADIRAYAQANPSFPHESTSEQWFGESQFEAYRALGAHQMELLCGNSPLRHPARLTLDCLRHKAEQCMSQAGG
jgi:hypothetical protein